MRFVPEENIFMVLQRPTIDSSFFLPTRHVSNFPIQSHTTNRINARPTFLAAILTSPRSTNTKPFGLSKGAYLFQQMKSSRNMYPWPPHPLLAISQIQQWGETCQTPVFLKYERAFCLLVDLKWFEAQKEAYY